MDKNKKDILLGIMVLSVEISLLYYLWQNNIVLAVLLLVVSAIVLLTFSSRAERIIYFVCFFLGPIFDLILVPRGAWSYGNPSLFGVPIWLPVTYGLGTVMVVKIGNGIARLM